MALIWTSGAYERQIYNILLILILWVVINMKIFNGTSPKTFPYISYVNMIVKKTIESNLSTKILVLQFKKY